MSNSDFLSLLRDLSQSGETGVLRTPAGDDEVRTIYLMGGQVIACSTDRDQQLLGELLVAQHGISADDLEAAEDEAGPDGDLADILVQADLVTGQQMTEARSALFRDNIAWTSVGAGEDHAFEPLDMVFPPNMQLGVDFDELVTDLESWSQRITRFLDLLPGDELWQAGDERPPGCGRDIWEALSEPHTMEGLLELLGPPHRDGAEKITLWLELDALVPPGDDSAEDTELAATAEVEEDDGDHYAKAARGGFIKSYEVLDKVDLSGVEVVGADGPGGPSQPDSLEPIEVGDALSLEAIEAVGEEALSMEAIEAIADEDLDGHSGEDDLVLDLESAPVDLPATTRPELQTLDAQVGGELASGDFEIFDEGSEEADLEFDVESAESIAAVAIAEDEIEDAGESASIQLDELDSPFTREQLNSFHDRIGIFNNIFRIIFATFAEHIGSDKSQQRFNALLGSGQRQYPELFKDIRVQHDGTVSAAPLINNLANCPPGDYGSLLHQGLYELIFSHLYDAKDMLPGDAEMQMMEQIVVFERQLHSM
jgi:hypothetical protein